MLRLLRICRARFVGDVVSPDPLGFVGFGGFVAFLPLGGIPGTVAYSL